MMPIFLLLESPHFMAAYTQKIQQLYVAYFNRPADAGGLEYWDAIVTKLNGDVTSVSSAFAQSAEYRAAYAGMSNADVVNQVYLNLFGRAAEDEGKAYWSNLLDTQTISVDNVVTTVALGARNSDLVAYSSKVSAASAFTAALQAKPDPDAYVGMASALAARGFISAVTDAASLQTAILPANLQDTIAFVKAASTPSVTFDLTTGVDKIGPTSKTTLAGHDTFNANSIGTNQTININDAIDGGAGKNTLNINSQTNEHLYIPVNVAVKNMHTVNLNADSTVNLSAGKWSETKNLNVKSVGNTDITAPSSSNIKIDGTLGAGGVKLNGGANVLLNIKNTTGAGKIVVGDEVAPIGDVTITSEISALSSISNEIDVYANGNVNITQSFKKDSYSYNYAGKVSVQGGKETDSVTIKNEGLVLSYPVVISDVSSDANKAGVLKTVTVVNSNSVFIYSNSLEVLNLTNGRMNIGIENRGLFVPLNETLTLNLSNSSYSVLSESNGYKNIVVDLIGSSKIDEISSKTAKKLTIKGGGFFSTDNFKNLTSLEKIVVEGNAGLRANLSYSGINLVDTSAANADGGYDNSLTIDASITRYVGGAAKDNVTLLAGPLTQSVSLGAGDDSLTLEGFTFFPAQAYDGGEGIDTLYFTENAMQVLYSVPDFSSMFVNFERFGFSKYFDATVDMKNFGNIKRVAVENSSDLTVDSFYNGGVLTINGHYVRNIKIKNDSFQSWSTDSLNIEMSSSWFGDSSRLNNLKVDFVETINIKTDGFSFNKGGLPNTEMPLNFLDLSANGAAVVNLSGSQGIELKLNSSTIKTIDASKLLDEFSFSTSEVSNKLVIKGSESGFNNIDLRGTSGGVHYHGGSGADYIKLKAGSNVITVGKSANDLVTFDAGNSLNQLTTISDAKAGLSLNVLAHGVETFSRTRVTLPTNASLDAYANAVISNGLDASSNGALGWFQWRGDTYLVESLHNGIANPSFVAGTDLIIKLTGLHDLSGANFNNTEVFTLA